MIIEFFVPGIAKTAGSKRAFVNKKTGRAIITDDCKTGKDWKADVKSFAVKHYQGELFRGPVSVSLIFHMKRPNGHYGTGRNAGTLKPQYVESAHTKKPDIDKLSRAVMDSLTGVIWKDDAQVHEKYQRKIYSSRPGVIINIGGSQKPYPDMPFADHSQIDRG